MKLYSVMCVFIVVCVVCVTAGDSTTTLTTTTPPTTTTPTIEIECANHNSSCGTCTKNPKCLWCNTNPIKCIPYPGGQIIPHKSVCDLGEARWGVCWVNYKVLLIVMGCVAAVLIISFSCCIYCCCCRRKGGRNETAQEEAKFEREREDRRSKHSERRAERQSKMDDIRRKYGLAKEGDSQYKRFENEA